MPTRIPIYKSDLDEIYVRLDKDKAEIKKEIHDSALAVLNNILVEFNRCNYKPKEEVKKPIPIKKK